MRHRKWLLSPALYLIALWHHVAAQQAVIGDAQASAHVGETATVEGVVANVFTSRAGNTFLNFGRAYPNQTFTAVVFRSTATRRFRNPRADRPTRRAGVVARQATFD